MLIDFSVENYRSIADKQTLSMVASKLRSDAEGQAAVDCAGFKHQLLTSAVIYGANGSGKSNLLRALSEFRYFVKHSASEDSNEIQPYLLDPAFAQAPTRFEASFILEGVRFQYGFSIDAERVQEEWLLAYPRRTAQVWFERRWNGIKHEVHFSSHLKGEKNKNSRDNPSKLPLPERRREVQPNATGAYIQLDHQRHSRQPSKAHFASSHHAPS